MEKHPLYIVTAKSLMGSFSWSDLDREAVPFQRSSVVDGLTSSGGETHRWGWIKNSGFGLHQKMIQFVEESAFWSVTWVWFPVWGIFAEVCGNCVEFLVTEPCRHVCLFFWDHVDSESRLCKWFAFMCKVVLGGHFRKRHSFGLIFFGKKLMIRLSDLHRHTSYVSGIFFSRAQDSNGLFMVFRYSKFGEVTSFDPKGCQFVWPAVQRLRVGIRQWWACSTCKSDTRPYIIFLFCRLGGYIILNPESLHLGSLDPKALCVLEKFAVVHGGTSGSQRHAASRVRASFGVDFSKLQMEKQRKSRHARHAGLATFCFKCGWLDLECVPFETYVCRYFFIALGDLSIPDPGGLLWYLYA